MNKYVMNGHFKNKSENDGGKEKMGGSEVRRLIEFVRITYIFIYSLR